MGWKGTFGFDPSISLRDTHISQAKWVIPEIISQEEPQEVWIYQADIQEEEKETTDECEACTQRHILEDQLKILADKEHLGITKSEW